MSILHEFKRLAAQTHDTVEGVKQDLLFDVAMFVKKSMNELGMSQREFAKRIGMKESQLSRILNTECNITAETISRLYWAVNCSPTVTIRTEEFVIDNLIAENVIAFPAAASTARGGRIINSEIAETEIEQRYEVAHG